MTALIICGGILAFLLLLLFLPVTVNLKYDRDFILKVYYAGIKVYGTDKNKEPAHPPHEKEEEKEQKEKKQIFFVRDYERMPKVEFIKYYAAVAKCFILKLYRLVKRMRIVIKLFYLSVATDNAADTAVQYGAVSAAVSPAISLLCDYAKVKIKKADIRADFVDRDYRFRTNASISVCLIFLLAFGLSALKMYKALDDGSFKEKYLTDKKQTECKETNDKESEKNHE